MNPPLIMPYSVLNQISRYRNTLLSNMGGGEKAAGAGQEQFSFGTANDILVLESVDEDVEGADATMRDELIMMAHDGDPIWVEELRKYLQKEEKEREQMKEEHVVRLARWQEDITVEPT